MNDLLFGYILVAIAILLITGCIIGIEYLILVWRIRWKTRIIYDAYRERKREWDEWERDERETKCRKRRKHEQNEVIYYDESRN